MANRAFRIGALILSIGFGVSFLTSGNVHAAGGQTLNATVKISVCGNGIVEGGEDCEPPGSETTYLDRAGATKTRTCDISCSFFPEECPDALPLSVSNPSTSPSPKTKASTGPGIPAGVSAPIPILPPRLTIFDTNDDQKISRSELASVLGKWLGYWRDPSRLSDMPGAAGQQGKTDSKCDLNSDSVCDMRDLSILLYYVDR